MIKISFALLLLGACQSLSDATYQPPTGLSISNPVWTRSDPKHIYQGVEVCEHDFTIKNSSNHFVYDQIIVKSSYFDHQHRLLHEELHKIRHQLKPGEFYRVKGLSGGHVRPTTDSASINLVKAVRKLQPAHE